MMTTRMLLLPCVSVGLFLLQGCEYFPESSFTLADGSRLPAWIDVPSGTGRGDAHLTMSYYIKPSGRSAVFSLKVRGKNLQSVRAELGCSKPFKLAGATADYPSYEAISYNGRTEMIEHKKMEPIFYVSDDPVVRKQYQDRGCS